MEDVMKRVGALSRWMAVAMVLVISGFVSQTMMSAGQSTSPSPAATVVAPGAQVEKLAGGFIFTEGPTSDAEGNVYFVDQDNNRIMKYDIAGTLSTFMQPSGYANGMA